MSCVKSEMAGGPHLRAVPITRDQANLYVERYHRHAGRLPVTRFQVAVADESGLIRGVAIAGNPKARELDDGWELEVNRVCTDGCRNACSFLYARCVRFGRAAGFTDAWTYTADRETGASLKASGWTIDGQTEARDWAKERGAGRTASGGPRVRWVIRLAEPFETRWPEALHGPAPASLFDAAAMSQYREEVA